MRNNPTFNRIRVMILAVFVLGGLVAIMASNGANMQPIPQTHSFNPYVEVINNYPFSVQISDNNMLLGTVNANSTQRFNLQPGQHNLYYQGFYNGQTYEYQYNIFLNQTEYVTWAIPDNNNSNNNNNNDNNNQNPWQDPNQNSDLQPQNGKILLLGKALVRVNGYQGRYETHTTQLRVRVLGKDFYGNVQVSRDVTPDQNGYFYVANVPEGLKYTFRVESNTYSLGEVNTTVTNPSGKRVAGLFVEFQLNQYGQVNYTTSNYPQQDYTYCLQNMNLGGWQQYVQQAAYGY